MTERYIDFVSFRYSYCPDTIEHSWIFVWEIGAFYYSRKSSYIFVANFELNVLIILFYWFDKVIIQFSQNTSDVIQFESATRRYHVWMKFDENMVWRW